MDLEHVPFFQDEFDLQTAHPVAWDLVVQLCRDLGSSSSRDAAAARIGDMLLDAPKDEDHVQERDLLLPVAARRLGYLVQTGPQSEQVRHARRMLDSAIARLEDTQDAPSLAECAARDKLRREFISQTDWDGTFSYELFLLRQREKRRARFVTMTKERRFALLLFVPTVVLSLGLAVALLATPQGSPALALATAVLLFAQALVVLLASGRKSDAHRLPVLSARVVLVVAIDLFCGAFVASAAMKSSMPALGVGVALGQIVVCAVLASLAVDATAVKSG
jgi:hypothetical protein